MQLTANSPRLAVGILSLSVSTSSAPAQTPVLELDHVYIVVQPPVSQAAEALRRAGLTLDTTVNRHPGQGTASIAVFFENAYLELLWIDPQVPVDTDHASDFADFTRAANWRTSGASPFGLGLHFVNGTAADLPLPSRRLPAPHLGPTAFYLLLRLPQESLATALFIMPVPAAVPSWISRFQGRRPDLFAHAMGAHRITGVVVHGSPANRPQAADLGVKPVTFEVADKPYVVVEFDGGVQSRMWDLRPAVPIILRR
jgi:hypothetical protein